MLSHQYSEQTDQGVEPKDQKRIDSLSKSSGYAIILAVIGIFVPVIALIGPLIGFGYAFESNSLLKRYPGLNWGDRNNLEKAKRRFLWMGFILVGYWVLVALLVVLFLLTETT